MHSLLYFSVLCFWVPSLADIVNYGSTKESMDLVRFLNRTIGPTAIYSQVTFNQDLSINIVSKGDEGSDQVEYLFIKPTTIKARGPSHHMFALHFLLVNANNELKEFLFYPTNQFEVNVFTAPYMLKTSTDTDIIYENAGNWNCSISIRSQIAKPVMYAMAAKLPSGESSDYLCSYDVTNRGISLPDIYVTSLYKKIGKKY